MSELRATKRDEIDETFEEMSDNEIVQATGVVLKSASKKFSIVVYVNE